MLDFHTHVLFDVDHGVQDFKTYCQLIREYVKQGFDTVVFTPHVNHPNAGCKSANIEKNFNIAREIAEKEGIKVILGSEIYLDGSIEDYKVLPVSDNYVLVEFPPTAKPLNLEKLLADLSNRGYRIVIAHVERYEWLNVRSKTFAFMRDMGCLFQVNSQSVRKGLAAPYIRGGVVDIIASDNHGDIKAPKRLRKILNKHNEILAKMHRLDLE